VTFAQSQSECPSCRQFSGDGVFCASCGLLTAHPESGAFVATRWRRLGGAILESLLFVVTLGVGWLIWLYFTSQHAQTPAKQILGMYILRRDGTPATAGRVWLREIVFEILVFSAAGWFLGGIPGIIDGAWILWDKDRQTLHDKMADTIVVRPVTEWSESQLGAMDGSSQLGVRRRAAPDTTTQTRLRELRDLADQGLITAAEYEDRRRRILEDV
jgi:uncharacterized RDD family membrane protein YckC